MAALGKFIGMSPVICVIQPGEVPIIVLFWLVFWSPSDAVFVISHREGKFRVAHYSTIRELR